MWDSLGGVALFVDEAADGPDRRLQFPGADGSRGAWEEPDAAGLARVNYWDTNFPRIQPGRMSSITA